MAVFYTHLRCNFIFTIIAFIAFNQIPTLARAQEYEYAPIDFIAPVNVTRGTLSPIHEGAIYLSDKDACHLLTVEMGWEKEECAAVDKYIVEAIPTVDSVIFEIPNSEGHVKFDDWDSEDRDDEINEIWTLLEESLEAQSKNLGIPLKAESWHVYPTLDKEKSVMYYATLIDWNGEPIINIKVTKFDRKGYVSFIVVPNDNISAEQTREMVLELLPLYTAEQGQRYAEFVTGDKVAAAGVVGVLATLVGVKYGKGAAAGLVAFLLLIAKKAWFLLLLPFVYLKKFFKRKDNDD